MNFPNPQQFPPQYTTVPGYAQQPQYAPQQYAQPQQAAPAPQLARGTIEDFFNQPSGGMGGVSVTKYFAGRVQGSWIHLRVLKDITNADVRQQTDINQVPQTFKDGTPKFVLIIPVQVIGSGDSQHPSVFTEGVGSLWVKGLLKDELTRAMTAGGDPTGIPKAGSEIVMISAGEKPSNRAGFSATKLYQLQYQAPVADPTAQSASAIPAAAVVPAPVTPPAPAVPPVPATVPFPSEVPQPGFAAPAPVAAPPAMQSREALLAKLNPGGQQ